MDICPKCKGDGYIRNTPLYIFEAVCTAGLIPLIESLTSDRSERPCFDKCNICSGKGIFEV